MRVNSTTCSTPSTSAFTLSVCRVLARVLMLTVTCPGFSSTSSTSILKYSPPSTADHSHRVPSGSSLPSSVAVRVMYSRRVTVVLSLLLLSISSWGGLRSGYLKYTSAAQNWVSCRISTPLDASALNARKQQAKNGKINVFIRNDQTSLNPKNRSLSIHMPHN